LATKKLRGISDREKRKQKMEASPSGVANINPKIHELDKLVKSLSAEMERLKLKGN
jgi:hypothetical protein